MRYSQSDATVVDTITGHRLHQDTAPVPSAWSAEDANMVIWSLMEFLNTASISPAAFDPAVPASYRRLKTALDQLYLSQAFDYQASYADNTFGWAQKQGSVKVAWFKSAVVAGDQALQIQATINFAQLMANGAFIEFEPNANYVCKTGITIDTNKVGVQGNGARLDFSTLPSGYAITVTQSNGDANQRTALNRAHPIQNLLLVGTASSVGSVTAVRMADQNPLTGSGGTTYWLAGVTFRNVAFSNFWRDVEFGNGAFLTAFDFCHFFITYGSGYDASIYAPSAINGGENLSFTGCFIGKVLGTGIRVSNPNATLFLRGCSGDYNNRLFDVSNGAEVDWDGYIEASNDTDYWGVVTGENSVLRVGGRISVTPGAGGGKTAKEMFYSDASCTNGGLVLDVSIQWGTTSYGNLDMVAGGGRAKVKLRSHSKTSVHPAVGGSTNLLSNPSFELASLAEWVLEGTTPPTRVAGPARTGAYSLRLPGGVTNTPKASRVFPCQPGDQLVGRFWYQTQALAASGGTFFVVHDYLNAAGEAIAGASNAVLAVTTDVAAWTFCTAFQFVPAPAGTASARISFSLFGTTSGSPNAYIDDITMAVV